MRRRLWAWGLAALLSACGGAGAPATQAPDAAHDGAGDGAAADTAAGDIETGDIETGDTSPEPRPPVPAGLKRWVVGDPEDVAPVRGGPGLILMGGGSDVGDAFRWAAKRTPGGDAVILRATGSDGYNDWLFETLGGFDSVETLKLPKKADADLAYVGWAVRHAELIFFAGGNQATYLREYKGTALQAAVKQAFAKGAIVGGTSAGLAVLGEWAFSAKAGSVKSAQALADPYHERMTFDRFFFELPPMAGIITDSHFSQRDRLGRLVAFLARLQADGWAQAPVIGLGVDEATAVVVGPDGQGEVMGKHEVVVVRATGPAKVCAPGVALSVAGWRLWRRKAGDTLSPASLPASGAPASWGPGEAVSAGGGELTAP